MLAKRAWPTSDTVVLDLVTAQAEERVGSPEAAALTLEALAPVIDWPGQVHSWTRIQNLKYQDL